jgi:hypothetical protein
MNFIYLNNNFYKLIFIILLFFISSFFLCLKSLSVKTSFIPINDAHPNRYNYHKLWEIDKFSENSELLFKAEGSYRYQRSFNNDKNGLVIFGNNPIISTYQGNNGISLSGGKIGIGFGEGFANSTTFINGFINNNYIDINGDIAKINSNFYLHLAIPVERSANRLVLSESVLTNDEVIKGGFSPEYLLKDPSSMDIWQSTQSKKIKAIGSFVGYLEGKTIGDMQKRKFALLKNNCTISRWDIADVYCQIGWDGIHTKKTQSGPYFKLVIPTTQQLNFEWARYIFSPVIGNAGRWEFGVGFNGHFWMFDCDLSSFKIVFDGYLSTVFANKHVRTFDLINGPITRYAGVKVFNSDFNYQNSLMWVSDLTTQCIDVSIPLRYEIVLDFIYKYKNHRVNIGYNFKGQSSEVANCCFNFNKFANYGLCSQQYIQIPNPNKFSNNVNWVTNYITPKSGMYEISKDDISIYKDTDEVIVGVPVSKNNIIDAYSIDKKSGLMGIQILNIIFGGYEYMWTDNKYSPIVGIKGSLGFSSYKYFSSEFWDIDFYIGISY